MKRFIAAAALIGLVQGANAETIKIGIVLGLTGPAESLAAPMGEAAELAVAEVNDSGAFMNGTKVEAISGDTTCVDGATAVAVAERLVSGEGVKAIVGGLCSSATIAILQNVTKPKGILHISPGATSPALTTLEDDGLFFRDTPSDAKQGEIIADMLWERGVRSIALTYTNNDYGKGLADSTRSNFEKKGGKLTVYASHEDGKGDYSAEVGTLAAAGGDILVVVGYLDQGGRGIIQSALDTGAFDQFFLPDAMIGDSLLEAIGAGLNGSYGVVPGSDSPGAATFATMAKKAGFEASPYSGEAYDAAALTLLAMHAAKSTDGQKAKNYVMRVANAPGVKIYPGELGKAFKLISAGKDIDYVGASAVELIGVGESAGNYRTVEVVDGHFETTGYR